MKYQIPKNISKMDYWIQNCQISSDVFSQIDLSQRDADEIIRISKIIAGI